MKRFTVYIVLLGWLSISLPSYGGSPVTDKELEFECGSDKVCRAALREEREMSDLELVDLIALEEKILAEGGQMKDEAVSKAQSQGERKPQAIVRRPPRPSGPRP